MTNIFARKPNTNLPARRYEQFISVFEKRVAEIQKQVTQMEKMESIYTVVREAMEAADLKNDSKIELGPNQVKIKITATLTDTMVAFDALLRGIGKALCDAGLHEDGEGTIRRGGYWWDVDATWAIKRDGEVRTVAINIDMPRAGIADTDIVAETKVVTMENTIYSYRPRLSREATNV